MMPNWSRRCRRSRSNLPSHRLEVSRRPRPRSAIAGDILSRHNSISSGTCNANLGGPRTMRKVSRPSPANGRRIFLGDDLVNTSQEDATADARRSARTAADALYANDTASRALGIELLDVAPGCVRVAMTVRADMVNGHGICHGGVLFTLADSAFAFACNSHGEPMVAAGASIEFLAPAPRGARVTATATETSRTARGGIYDVVVAGETGEPLAYFRGRCARLRLPAQPAVQDEPK